MSSSNPSFNEYRTLVEQARIPVWRADLTMGCNYFNDRWLAFTGRTMEQERGKGWAEGVHSDDMERCLKIYTESFARQEIFEMEHRLRRADGTYRRLFDRGVPFQEATGEFAGYIGSCVDVTERVEDQAQLRASHHVEVKMLRQLLPVCSWCRKVREESGCWKRLEAYVTAHSALRFTHGI
jgi:PAS domain S-box-containing protein